MGSDWLDNRIVDNGLIFSEIWDFLVNSKATLTLIVSRSGWFLFSGMLFPIQLRIIQTARDI